MNGSAEREPIIPDVITVAHV